MENRYEIFSELHRRVNWHEKEYGKKPDYIRLTWEEWAAFEAACNGSVSFTELKLCASDARFCGVEVKKPNAFSTTTVIGSFPR